MIDNDLQGQDNQLVLSYELLALLEWLIDHEPQTLQLIIKRALAKGLKKKVKSLRFCTSNKASLEAIQHTVIDFFAVLEQSLNISLHEDIVAQAVQNDLLHSIDQIDSQTCDTAILAQSIEHATQALEKHPEQNPKELLYRELLRRWNPQKNEISN